MSTLPSQRKPRAFGIAAVLVLLAMLAAVTILSVETAGNDSELGSAQLCSTRAIFAADSGAMIISKCLRDGLAVPASGTTSNLGAASVTFVSLPQPGEAGEARVEGRSGGCVRSVALTLEPP